MKKILSLMFTAALILSLAACGDTGKAGDNNPSGEEDRSPTEVTETEAAEATDLTYEEIIENYTVMPGREYELAAGNKAKRQQFWGNQYIISGTIDFVETNYCVIRPLVEDVDADGQTHIYDMGLLLHAYLPADTLADLEAYQEITVAGTISETDEDILLMKNAYQFTEEERLKFLFGYDGTPETVMEKALNFGNDKDNHITWTENSFPYFIKMQHMFPLMSDDEIKENIVGRWSVIEYINDAGDTREYIFMEDGTGKKQRHKDDSEEDYEPFYWSVDNGMNYIGRAC